MDKPLRPSTSIMITMITIMMTMMIMMIMGIIMMMITLMIMITKQSKQDRCPNSCLENPPPKHLLEIQDI